MLHSVAYRVSNVKTFRGIFKHTGNSMRRDDPLQWLFHVIMRFKQDFFSGWCVVFCHALVFDRFRLNPFNSFKNKFTTNILLMELCLWHSSLFYWKVERSHRIWILCFVRGFEARPLPTNKQCSLRNWTSQNNDIKNFARSVEGNESYLLNSWRSRLPSYVTVFVWICYHDAFNHQQWPKICCRCNSSR